jgi:hypothetical protein
MFRAAAATFTMIATFAAAPVAASDVDGRAADTAQASPQITANAARKFMVLSEPLPTTTPPRAATLGADVEPVPTAPSVVAARRGALLPTLYVSLAGLNAVDAYTTTKGLSMGATEANPLLKTIAGNQAAFWALKGGVTAGSIVVAERLWRKHRRVEAIAVMVISNGMMAAVAARNVGVLRQQ